MDDLSEFESLSAALHGQYAVIREIGRGGTGVVYLARDIRLDRLVAIKTLARHALADESARERFLREARTAAALSHPNIVPIYRADEIGELVFFVMGYVDGHSLADRIAHDGPLNSATAVLRLREIALALDYAHSCGIVHRDVKAENILVEGTTGTALVADFGIARQVGVSSLTPTGQLLGTVAYLSPEQVGGEPADARSDLYALGVLGYFVLSGRFPFDAELTSVALVARVVRDAPSILSVAPEVPLTLAGIVNRLLSRNPDQRFQTGADVAAALLDVQTDGVIATNTVGRTRARNIALSALTLVLLTLGTVAVIHRAIVGAEKPSLIPNSVNGIPDNPNRVTNVSFRYRHACGLTAEGTAYCWGNNSSGQLGSGWDEDTISEPIPVAGTLRFKQLKAGSYHSCGLSIDGKAYCWGSGYLGTASEASRSAPALVGGELTFASISAGGHHTCGVTTSKAAYCWGFGPNGELGGGTTGLRAAPAAVTGGLQFSSISAGDGLTCGVAVDSTAYCWGKGDDGQLGDGSTRDSAVPVAVSGGLHFATVSAGSFHACGAKGNGAAYCWGNNDSGQVGNGKMGGPVSVPEAVFGGHAFASLTVGAAFTCGVTSTGAAACWGFGGTGQLGNGNAKSTAVPTQVAGGLQFLELSAGYGSTCGVATTGAAYCWGANQAGQLGNGTKLGFATPVAVNEFGPLKAALANRRAALGILGHAARISAGAFHSCVVTADHSAYCWGSNESGQLGNGMVGDTSAVPVAVVGGHQFAMVSAGSNTTCGVTTVGVAFCWGSNFQGALGNGTKRQNVPEPVAVAGGLTFTTVSVGNGNSCGVTTGGAAFCWGDNYYGQLGDGTGRASPVPVVVSGGIHFQEVSVGSGYTCGVATTGVAYCWGDNSRGSLRDSSHRHIVPVAITGDEHFVSISTGGEFACGRILSGIVYCWGPSNDEGQLGKRMLSRDRSDLPTSVIGSLSFKEISAGQRSVCGVTLTNRVYCWGARVRGQRGGVLQWDIGATPTSVATGLTIATVSVGSTHTCGVTQGGAAYCWGNNSESQLGNGTRKLSASPVAVRAR